MRFLSYQILTIAEEAGNEGILIPEIAEKIGCTALLVYTTLKHLKKLKYMQARHRREINARVWITSRGISQLAWVRENKRVLPSRPDQPIELLIEMGLHPDPNEAPIEEEETEDTENQSEESSEAEESEEVFI
jgi:hypothetical protein